MSDYKIKKINTDVDCEISIEVELKSKAIEENKSEALKRINENVKGDGFRPGHIPEKVLIEKEDLRALTLPEKSDLTMIDISNISLTHVIKDIASLTKEGGEIIVLIKPFLMLVSV